MFIPKSFVAAIVLAMLSNAANAHEFWTEARPFSPAPGSDSHLYMFVGQYFDGVQVGYVTTHTTMLKHYSVEGVEDLIGKVPAVEAVGEIPVTIRHAGAHLIAFDSVPNPITLSADKFEAYLHDEGLDPIIAQRAAAGNTALPGRERFRRNTKTLLRAGGRSDATFAVRTNQRLEIVPLNDPLTQPAGASLRFKLYFDGKPVRDAILRAWHHEGNETVSIRASTDAQGEVRYVLPFAGSWMLSTVYMTPATDTAEADWDSYWGSLMFEVPRLRR